MEVISIEPKQVSMMVGTEVAPPYCKPCTRRPPSSLSARRTAMSDNEMVFGAEGGGARRSYSPTTAGTRPPRRRPARRSAPSRARARGMTPSSRCA